jgi:malate dehydrogenase (oxaloacetate-decarboxylating)
MLLAGTKALAAQGPAMKDPKAGLLPDVKDVREISVQVAKAVIKQVVEEGLNEEEDIPTDDKELEEWIREQMWEPEYKPYKRVDKEGASKHAKGEAGIQGAIHS